MPADIVYAMFILSYDGARAGWIGIISPISEGGLF